LRLVSGLMVGVMSALLTFRAWGRKSQGMFVD
jgi:hypothetical protein